jgi:hypothetical protein
MANFGVNLEEVWQQASLTGSIGSTTPTKYSPYTVPVQPKREGFGNRTEPGNVRRQEREFMVPQEIPISGSDYANVTSPPPHQAQPQPPMTQPSEIPRLKEQLTQQIDAVTDCQKEVVYLKALVQALKRELVDADQKRQHQQKMEKKQKMINIIWMVCTVLFLIVIIVLLVQVTQKVNQLLSQPLLMG